VSDGIERWASFAEGSHDPSEDGEWVRHSGMVGRLYTWRSGACSTGIWRVVCRWLSIPGIRVVHNVRVENIETGEWTIRPWYPAPKRVLLCPECRLEPAINRGRCFECRARSML